jgi:hypothetical protein
MKKLLLIACVAFMGMANVQAQCTPDAQFTAPGIYPDSATNFASACVGQPYTQVITNVVPADTCVQILPVPFPCNTLSMDSIVLTGVTGLPPGMNYACNPTSCTYIGGAIGCAIISGTCNTAGTYNISFSLDAYVGGIGTPQSFTVDYYKIVVNSCSAGIEENTSNLFQLFPNPTNSKAVIEGLSGNNSISIANAAGKIMQTYTVTEGTSLEMNLEGLNNGLYFVSVKHDKGTEVLKLIKE